MIFMPFGGMSHTKDEVPDFAGSNEGITIRGSACKVGSFGVGRFGWTDNQFSGAATFGTTSQHREDSARTSRNFQHLFIYSLIYIYVPILYYLLFSLVLSSFKPSSFVLEGSFPILSFLPFCWRVLVLLIREYSFP
jgi:hypothetical protein